MTQLNPTPDWHCPSESMHAYPAPCYDPQHLRPTPAPQPENNKDSEFSVISERPEALEQRDFRADLMTILESRTIANKTDREIVAPYLEAWADKRAKPQTPAQPAPLAQDGAQVEGLEQICICGHDTTAHHGSKYGSCEMCSCQLFNQRQNKTSHDLKTMIRSAHCHCTTLELDSTANRHTPQCNADDGLLHEGFATATREAYERGQVELLDDLFKEASVSGGHTQKGWDSHVFITVAIKKHRELLGLAECGNNGRGDGNK